MELVRQPHPKKCLLSMWCKAHWVGLNCSIKVTKDDAWVGKAKEKLRRKMWADYSYSQIRDAVADESCARWHELVAGLSESDRGVLGRCVE